MDIWIEVARRRRIATFFAVLCGILLLAPGLRANAQTRVNDHDMEALMRNLRDDAKAFRPRFDAAVHRSTIRKTSQEKDARGLAASFSKQTDDLLNRFKKNRNGAAELNAVMGTAEQLDRTIHSLSLGPQVNEPWRKIRAELHRIAAAFGAPEPFAQSAAMAPSGESIPCLQSAGAVKANQLVNECLQVSPATHPPCNAENSCALIISEIKRSCALLGAGAPGFCADYR